MSYTYNEIEISDLHKDVYGFRPSYDFWREWELSSPDAKQEIWDRLIDALEPDDIDPGDMDGDHASGLASAGWGTDEDYGSFDSDW